MNSQYRKLLDHDLDVGIRMRWRVYFTFFCYVVMVCLVYHFRVIHFFQMDKMQMIPSSGDYLLNFIGGGLPQNYVSKDGFYTIPVVWLVTFFTIFLIHGQYARHDFSASSYQYFIRARDKRKWWISKIMWLTISVWICFLIILLVCIFCGILLGHATMVPTLEINRVFHETNVLEFTSIQVIEKAFIIPMIMVAGLCAFQVMLSFLVNQMFAYMVMVVILIVSSYKSNYLLLGNYVMAFRDKRILGEDGIYLEAGAIIGILIFTISVIGGYFILKKKDVI